MPKPLRRPTIVKKRTKPFRRHEADRYIRISKTGYRKPKGIDNRMRRRFSGTRPLVSIGYGSAKKTRHLLPNHFYKYRVRNVKDLEVLLMHNQTYAAEIAHEVSVRTRKEILERAAQLDIKVLNANARIRTEENE